MFVFFGGFCFCRCCWVALPTRVLVSATGECTPVNDDGDSIHGDDVNDFSMGIDEVTEQHRTRSLPHLSFGKLTGSFEDKVVDAFIWLRRQTKGKQIYATKVHTNPKYTHPHLSII